MKVLLLSETNSTPNQTKAFPSTMFHLGSMLGKQPLLGLPALKGVKVTIDTACPTDIEQVLAKHSPDVVGISVYEDSIQHVSQMCEYIPREITVIVGGHGATLLPRTTLTWTMADILCRGEADFTFRQVIEALSKNRPICGIDGVWVKDLDSTIKTGDMGSAVPIIPRDLLEKIQPSSTLLLDAMRNKDFDFTMTTARGCAFGNCAFCQVTTDERRMWRALSTEITVQRIKWAYKHLKAIVAGKDARYLNILDPLFGGPKKELEKLLNQLKNALPKIRQIRDGIALRVSMSVDQLLQRGKIGSRTVDTELINLMERAGIFKVELGVDSFSDGILTRLKHGRYTAEEAKNVVIKLAEAGIHIAVCIILSDSTATRKEVDQSITRILELNEVVSGFPGELSFAINSYARPLVGTPLYRKTLRELTRKDLETGRATGELSLDLEYPYYNLRVRPSDPDLKDYKALADELKQRLETNCARV